MKTKTKVKLSIYTVWSVAALALFVAMLCFDHNHSEWVSYLDWAAILTVAGHLIWADELASSIKDDFAEEMDELDHQIENIPDEDFEFDGWRFTKPDWWRATWIQDPVLWIEIHNGDLGVIDGDVANNGGDYTISLAVIDKLKELNDKDTLN